jgi:hypothetical protein
LQLKWSFGGFCTPEVHIKTIFATENDLKTKQNKTTEAAKPLKWQIYKQTIFAANKTMETINLFNIFLFQNEASILFKQK